MVCVKPPVPAAVKDKLAVPAAAVLAALSVSVVEEPAVRVSGLNAVVTPLGAPESVRVSGALNVP